MTATVLLTPDRGGVGEGCSASAVGRLACRRVLRDSAGAQQSLCKGQSLNSGSVSLPNTSLFPSVYAPPHCQHFLLSPLPSNLGSTRYLIHALGSELK